MPLRIHHPAARPTAVSPRLAALPFSATAKVRTILDAKSAVKEPSGIVVHPGRGTLFVAGDRGDLAEVSLDGRLVQHRNIGERNFEGLTVGPKGRLFAIQEGVPPILCEIDPASLRVKAKYEVDSHLSGKPLFGPNKNKSAEGICYVASQRAFYCVNQQPPRLVKLQVPLDNGSRKTKAVSAIELPSLTAKMASDVAFDPVSNHFLVLESGSSNGPNCVHELSLKGQLIRTVEVPGDRTEGLTLWKNGTAFLAQDAGGVLRVDP